MSESSAAKASRVLAAGDEQVVEAIEAGQISVSDAASVIELPNSRQREALALVRSGKARTLREAVKARRPRSLPAAVLAGNPREPQVMRGKVRRAYRFFLADFDGLCAYVDMAADGCGGPNDFTRRAREALAAARHAMHECLLHHGRTRLSTEGA
ncbi:MAG TPA: hypothetical protein PK867_25410 [Pirellulales bacterium]|nr:hypothetical protein [Pirellulales bacterium]